MGRIIPSGGEKRQAMAENHQERCNPAIHPGLGAIIINDLRMAKDLHITKPNWYEAPIL
jgi:hypothetical protein